MLDPEEWDWERQKGETEQVVRDIRTQVHRLSPGQPIGLTVRFVPAVGTADPGGLIDALRTAGFSSGVQEPDGQMPRCVVATTDSVFDAGAIWEHEERSTRIALGYGFRPDGWGLTG
jgi:hypothetical protein